MDDLLKSYAAGIFIGLGAYVYTVCAGFSNALGYTALGAFLFSMGLLSICAEGLILVTGQFSKLYDGTWNCR